MNFNVLTALIQLDEIKEKNLTKEEIKLKVTRAINVLEKEFPEFKVENLVSV